MVFHHLAKFDDYSYGSGKDLMFLVCHVIKQHHVIKSLDDYNDSSRDVKVLVVHVIWQDHVIKGSCDFMCEIRLL